MIVKRRLVPLVSSPALIVCPVCGAQVNQCCALYSVQKNEDPRLLDGEQLYHVERLWARRMQQGRFLP